MLGVSSRSLGLTALIALAALAAGSSAGCYRAHVLGDGTGLDGGIRRDARPPDGPGLGPDVPRLDAPRVDVGLDPCATIDCPPPPVGCAVSFCAEGRCLIESIPGACPPGFVCDLSRGCVSTFDGGPPPRDAGRDAPAPPRDAPIVMRDAPRIDAPIVPIDAPPVDAPVVPVDAPRLDGGRDAGPPTSEAFRCTSGTVITVNDRTLLSIGPEMTFELWVRARGAGPITGKGEPDGQQHLILRLEPSADGSIALVGGWTTGAARAEVRVPFGANMGRWTHIAMVQRLVAGGVRVELWVDAVLSGSAVFADTTSDSFNDVPLLMCQLDADLDEVRLWSAARSPSLIAAQRFGTVPTDSPGLLAYWPLETRSQVQLDRTLLGNDAFLGTSSVPDPADPVLIPDGAF